MVKIKKLLVIGLRKKKNRSKVILGTKIAGPGVSWIRDGGNQYNKEKLNEAVNKSLKRLQTDYIDLYQLHWPERKTNNFRQLGYKHKNYNEWNNFEDILNSLDEIIKSGKVKYIGLSNETAWGLTKFLEISKTKNLPRVMSVQNPYNLLNRTYEIGLAEASIREKSGLLGYSPLASGTMSGKYRNGAMPEGSRMKLFAERFKRYETKNAANAIAVSYTHLTLPTKA